jgi:hypothetical protein
VQPCTAAGQVRYCLYPGFGSVLPSLEAPVGRVLAHLPARPARPLTVRQVTPLSLPDPVLTHGHSNQDVSRWDAEAQQAPGNASAAPASAIFIDAWPPAGGRQADAGFGLALATAEWALRFPAADGISGSTGRSQACVPVNQAREAVAIWLAIVTTHLSGGELRAGLGTGMRIQGTFVGGAFVRTWNYPAGYVTPPGGILQATAAGYLLASAMTSVPEQEVSQVLAAGWGRWLNWHTTDAQLAAALGIPMPAVSSPAITPPPGSGPQAPLCTT